jgi:hypothetical protein
MTFDMKTFLPFLGCKEKEIKLTLFVESFSDEIEIYFNRDTGTGSFAIKKHGVELVFVKGPKDVFLLETVAFISSHGHKGYARDGYKEYQGKMMHKLSFALDRTKTRKLLGDPAKSGGGTRIGKIRSPEWDQWTLDGNLVRVAYNDKTGHICVVRVSRAA